MSGPRHDEAKSRRLGRARLGTGVVTTAYRAVVEIACVQCAGTIAPGALFSRQTHRTPLDVPLRTTSALTTEPICVTCRPLRLEDTGETETATTDAREAR